jgi:hypothetical protein
MLFATQAIAAYHLQHEQPQETKHLTFSCA